MMDGHQPFVKRRPLIFALLLLCEIYFALGRIYYFQVEYEHAYLSFHDALDRNPDAKLQLLIQSYLAKITSTGAQ